MRENWDWSRKPSVVIWALFVIYPANCFKTRERLNEYKAFFEPDDMAISRNIKMGNEGNRTESILPSGRVAVEAALHLHE